MKVVQDIRVFNFEMLSERERERERESNKATNKSQIQENFYGVSDNV